MKLHKHLQHTLQVQNHPITIFVTKTNHKVIAKEIKVDIYSHALTGQNLYLITQESKKMLLDKNLSIPGYNIKLPIFIPVEDDVEENSNTTN